MEENSLEHLDTNVVDFDVENLGFGGSIEVGDDSLLENPQEDNWVQYVDEETGNPYFYNEITGEARWIEVAVCNWDKFYDDDGNEYYYNKETQESVWERPVDYVEPAADYYEYDENMVENHTEQENQLFPLEENGQTPQQIMFSLDDALYESGRKESEKISPIRKVSFYGNQKSFKGGTSDMSIKSGSSFNYSPHTPHSVRKLPSLGSFSDKKVTIRVGSNSTSPPKEGHTNNALERKTSNNSMKSIYSLMQKNTTQVTVSNELKPNTPLVRTKSGFNLLKEDATEIRRMVDTSSGLLWIEYQAANNGPNFYTREVVNSVRPGGAIAVGQWVKPDVFVKEDLGKLGRNSPAISSGRSSLSHLSPGHVGPPTHNPSAAPVRPSAFGAFKATYTPPPGTTVGGKIISTSTSSAVSDVGGSAGSSAHESAPQLHIKDFAAPTAAPVKGLAPASTAEVAATTSTTVNAVLTPQPTAQVMSKAPLTELMSPTNYDSPVRLINDLNDKDLLHIKTVSKAEAGPSTASITKELAFSPTPNTVPSTATTFVSNAEAMKQVAAAAALKSQALPDKAIDNTMSPERALSPSTTTSPTRPVVPPLSLPSSHSLESTQSSSTGGGVKSVQSVPGTANSAVPTISQDNLTAAVSISVIKETSTEATKLSIQSKQSDALADLEKLRKKAEDSRKEWEKTSNLSSVVGNKITGVAAPKTELNVNVNLSTISGGLAKPVVVSPKILGSGLEDDRLSPVASNSISNQQHIAGVPSSPQRILTSQHETQSPQSQVNNTNTSLYELSEDKPPTMTVLLDNKLSSLQTLSDNASKLFNKDVRDNAEVGIKYGFENTIDGKKAAAAVASGSSSPVKSASTATVTMSITQQSNQPQTVVDFAMMYPRSTIKDQRRPWTQLYDPVTEKTFYRNESEKFFQLEMPSLFLIPEPAVVVSVDKGRIESPSRQLAFKNEATSSSNVQFSHISSPNKHTSNSLQTTYQSSKLSQNENEDDDCGVFLTFTNPTESESKNTVKVPSAEPLWNAVHSPVQSPNRVTKKSPTKSPQKQTNTAKDTAVNLFEKDWHDLYAKPSGVDPEGLTRSLILAERISSTQRHNVYKDTHCEDAHVLLHRLSLINGIGNSATMQAATMNATEPRTNGNKTKTQAFSSTNNEFSVKVEKSMGEKSTLLSIGEKENLQQLQQCRELVSRTCTLLECIDVSWLEHEINQKYILNATQLQRNQLISPRGLRDSAAYSSLPLSICCPQNMSSTEINANLVQRDTNNNNWSVYTHKYCNKDKLIYVKNDNVTTNTTSNGKIKTKSASIQSGEPLDICMTKCKSDLKPERWSDYIFNVPVNQNLLQHQGIQLLSDPFGGYVFYNEKTDSWSSTGVFEKPNTANMRNGKSTQQPLYPTVGTQNDNTFPLNASTNAAMSANEVNKSLTWDRSVLTNLTSSWTQSVTLTRPQTASTPKTSSLNQSEGFAVSNGNVLRNNNTFLQSLNNTQNRQDNVWRQFNLDPQNQVPKGAFTTAQLSAMQEYQQTQQQQLSARDTSNNNNNTNKFNQRPVSANATKSDRKTMLTNISTPEMFSQTYTNNTGFSFSNTQNIMLGGSASVGELLGSNNSQASATSPPRNILERHMLDRLNDIENELTEQIDHYTPLHFETTLTSPLYTQYAYLVQQIAARADSAVHSLILMEFLIYQGCGKEGLAAFKHAMDTIKTNKLRQTMHDSAVCHILSIKLSLKYYAYYEPIKRVQSLLDSFPESPQILTHIAIYFHATRYTEISEQLFISVLLLDNTYEQALYSYAKLLCEKGNYRIAVRYLSRINDEKSVFYSMAKMELAWISEMRGSTENKSNTLQNAPTSGQNNNTTSSNHSDEAPNNNNNSGNTVAGTTNAAIQVAFKNCIHAGTSGTGISNHRVASCGMHAVAYHYFLDAYHSTASSMTIHDVLTSTQSVTLLNKSVETYNRALQLDDDNYIAHLLLAMSAAYCSSIYNTVVSESTQTTATTTTIYSKHKADSHYRRSVLLMDKRSYHYIALLAYAEYLHCVMLDFTRANEYYHLTVQSSMSFTVYPTIAYVQFLQYTLCDYDGCSRLLLKALRCYHTNCGIIQSIATFTAFKGNQNNSVDNDSPYGIRSGRDIRAPEPMDDDITCLYVAIAFYLLDVGDVNNATRYATAALSLKPTFSCALRCIGYITYNYSLNATNNVQKNKNKKLALRYYTAAFEYANSNPYTLKQYAIVKAMDNHYGTSIVLLETALRCTQNDPLLFRTLGILQYMYYNKTELALQYLRTAFVLSNYEDIDCIRICGQIYLNNEKYKDAKKCFVTALRLVPYDVVSLCGLGVCCKQLFPSPNMHTQNNKYNVNNMIVSLQSFDELINSQNYELLLAASMRSDLYSIVTTNMTRNVQNKTYAKQACKQKQRSVDILDVFSDQIDCENTNTNNRENTVQFISSYIYYHNAMHEYSKGTPQSINKAKQLFVAAANSEIVCDIITRNQHKHNIQTQYDNSSDSYTLRAEPPHLMSIYMLGVLAENEHNLTLAEEFYTSALTTINTQNTDNTKQSMCISGVALLQVCNVMEITLNKIKLKLKKAQKVDQQNLQALGENTNSTLKLKKKCNKKKKSSQKKSSLAIKLTELMTNNRNNLSDIHDNEDENSDYVSDTDIMYKNNNVSNQKNLQDSAENTFNLTATNVQSINNTSNIALLQRRVLMHQRLQETSQFQKYSYRKLLKKLVPPVGMFMYTDCMWLERVFDVWGKCDDWSWLKREMEGK